MNYLQKKKLAFMSVVNSVKGFVRNITGVFPLTLTNCVDSRSIIDYTIYGNSVQEGTPTPDNPIEVESVGEFDESTGKYKIPITLTGKNLLNLNDCYLDSTLQSQYGLSKPVIDGNSISCESIYTYHSSAISWKGNLEKGTYTVNGYSKTTSGTTSGVQISVNGSVINNLSPSIKKVTFTLAEDSEVRIDFFRPYKMEIGETMTWYNIQLEKGSVVTAYEPYHKPITTNIYLDEPLGEGQSINYKRDGLPPIPTFKGTSIISADTTIQPSNAEITYYSNVKE